MCPRGAVLLLLQILLNFDILLAAPSTGFQEEKGSGLESIPQKQLNLQKEFSISLKLSRQLLHKTKNLTQCYLSDRLPGVQVTLISHLGLLPSTSIDLHTWISLPDAKRLSQIAENLSLYQGLVQQLRNFEAVKENSKFTSQFEDVDVILRDLGHQVNYQISLWGLPSKIQPVPTPQILQHHSQWRNRQEVYIVLHSLKSLLVRVARDFLMLRMRVTKRTSFSRTFQSHHFLS
ncbi:interleukin-27 subunit alpha [Liasis olivaceus]